MESENYVKPRGFLCGLASSLVLLLLVMILEVNGEITIGGKKCC